MIKRIVKLSLLAFLVEESVIAEETTLTGPNVVHFKYPRDFIETSRFVRQGKLTPDGMCEFVSTMPRLKPGERIFRHEIAYDPTQCKSLMVQGRHQDREKR
jgi:hypothetical protein